MLKRFIARSPTQTSFSDKVEPTVLVPPSFLHFRSNSLTAGGAHGPSKSDYRFHADLSLRQNDLMAERTFPNCQLVHAMLKPEGDCPTSHRMPLWLWVYHLKVAPDARSDKIRRDPTPTRSARPPRL